MKHMIAVNTKHTGDPSKDHRGYAEPMSSEQLDRLLSEDWLKKMVADIRAGNEKLKDDLPFACPHYGCSPKTGSRKWWQTSGRAMRS